MYPTLKMWISMPTPVTTSVIIIDSWSSWNAASILRSPTGIHEKYRWMNGASMPPPPALRIAKKIAAASRNESTSTPGPTMLVIPANR